jgi:NADH-quinone oxidoreductase subunit K
MICSNFLFAFMLFIQLVINFYMFILGVLGVLTNRRHFLVVIIFIEIILLCVNICFLLFSLQLDDVLGQLFALFVLTVAAAESSIGLAIIILYYRNRGNISYNNRFSLKS